MQSTRDSGKALGELVANATLAGAVAYMDELRIERRGLSDEALDRLTMNLRAQAKAAVNRIVLEGQALVAAGRTPWLHTLAKAECAEAARLAVLATWPDSKK